MPLDVPQRPAPSFVTSLWTLFEMSGCTEVCCVTDAEVHIPYLCNEQDKSE